MKYIIKIIFSVLILVSTSAFAATYTWDGSSSNLWNTGANWVGDAVPPAGSDLVFPAGASNISTSNNIVAGTSFASITFGVGASAYTLAGNDIVLSGGATAVAANNTSLTMTISLNITFSTAAPTISVASDGTLTISGNIDNGGYTITHSCTGTSTLSGVISGTGGLTKTGAGDLTLSGTTSSYTGVTTSSGVGGELKVYKLSNGGSNSSIGASSNSAANLVFDGGRFGYYGSGDNTDRLFTLGTVASGAIIRHSGTGDLSFTNTAEISYTGTGTRLLSFWGSSSYLGTFAPIIGDGAGGATAVIKDGTGTWLVSGANTYTGLTTIDDGTLRLGSTTALGTTALGTTMTSGAVLDLNGIEYTNAEALTINGTGISSGGAITNSSATNTQARYNGVITLGSNSSIISVSGGIIINSSGNITGTGFNLTLGGTYNGTLNDPLNTSTGGSVTKIGSGHWSLGQANNYTGLTTVSAGRLRVNDPNALGTADAGTVVESGGMLDLESVTYAVAEPLTLNGTGGSSAGALRNSTAGAATFPGLITLGSASSIVAESGDINITHVGTITGATFGLTLGGAGAGNISSIIGTTSGTLTKEGAGTWTLSGANTYTGATTINAGTLKLGAAGVIPDASAVTVTGTLDMNTFSETVGSIAGAGTIDNVAGAGTPTLTCGGDNSGTTFSGIIKNTTGTLSLTKTGIGLLVLSGTNTYTGTTTISSSNLGANNASALGSITGGTVVNSGGTLVLYSHTYGAEPLTLNGTGSSELHKGALRLSISINTSVTFPGAITLASNSRIGVYDPSSTLVLSGVISGGFALDKYDSGTLTFSGANTYTGITTIVEGTIKLGATGDATNTPLGTIGAGTIVSASGACLDLAGYTLGTAEALTINGTGVSSGGALMNSGTAATYSGLLTLGSASSIIGGTGTIALSNAGTITGETYGLTLGGAQGGSITSIIGTTTGTLTKQGNGTWTLSGANTYDGATTVSAGILKLNNTAALGSNTAGTTVSDGAALDLNGITYATTEALTISGTGISSGGALINTGSSASFAGTVTMAANTNINTANQITLSGTISPSTYSLTKEGTNSLVFTSNTATVNNLAISAGTLSAGSSTINIYGNFTNSGTFTCGIGTVAFNGTAAQSIAVATFNNLTINNSTSPATSAATLTGNIAVGGILLMSTGILNTTSADTVMLGTTGTITETNPSSTDPSSYVTGYVATTRDLIQNVANTFGGIGLSLTETTQATNSTLVTRRTGTASTGAGNSSILRYFDVSPTVNSALNATMIFSYIDDELNGQSEDSLKLYRSEDTGSTWTKKAATSVNSAANTLSFSGITAFSRWTGSNKVSNPLPVDFISFTATKETDATALNWKTAQETNNDYFDIERSHDGISFEKITSIKGVGTTNSISSYSYLDKSTNQTLATYYRLKQVDFDKKTEYSNIVFVNGETNHKELNLFPNPLEEGYPLYACLGDNDEGIIKVSVFDITGKLLRGFLVDNVVANANIIIENENLLLKKGMYIIEIKSIHNDYKQKLEVK